MSTPFAADLLLGRRLADVADAITVGRFGADDLVVESKPDLTPVSDADRAVEVALRDVLGTERAGDSVSGEEFADSPGKDVGTTRRWVIDPIDGTKNFVRGVPVWATLIALLDHDRPVVGVVSAPALGRRWWADLGGGAWMTAMGRAARRLEVSRVASIGDASLSYASLGGWAEHGRETAFRALMDRCWRTRAYGDFWSYMLVAEGVVDLAAEPELSLWDLAALAPIVTEAGGRFTDLAGTDGVFGGNVAASNGLLHDDLVAALNG